MSSKFRQRVVGRGKKEGGRGGAERDLPGNSSQGRANKEPPQSRGAPDWWADGQPPAVGGARVRPSHRPRASLQCTACGRSGAPGACAPAAAGGGPGAGCGRACPPSTAARPARVPSCRLSSAVWLLARVSSARGLPAGWGSGDLGRGGSQLEYSDWGWGNP